MSAGLQFKWRYVADGYVLLAALTTKGGKKTSSWVIAQKWCYGHVVRALFDDSSYLTLAMLTNRQNKISDYLVALNLGFNKYLLPEFDQWHAVYQD